MRLTSRPIAVAAAVLVQAALAAWAVQPQLSARLTGAEYRLAVAPVDPIDPFRGAYVQLDYPDLPAEAPGSGRFHVPLVRDGSLWKGTAPVRTRPESPHLTCESRGGFLDCGLDSFFVSEDRARALEQDVAAGRLAAVIRVDDQGRAALVDLEHR
ncbi:GDYXXLXY domain-containing protein [Actinocorallia aurantiaca]|uniref:GDYXXLXY domain-containing protein n=1 Tax=Actinocorallia aurantiaca TaxID=46204 RepID=A0ABN3TXU3_9ACTN